MTFCIWCSVIIATKPMHRLHVHPIVHNYMALTTIPPTYIRVCVVVWECGKGQTTDTQTAMTNIHFASATPHSKCKKYTKELKRNKSRVCRDHPRCRSIMWICMRGHTPDTVAYSNYDYYIRWMAFFSHIYSNFHQNCSGVLEPPVGGIKISPFPLLWPLAFRIACITVQAVIHQYESSLTEVNGKESLSQLLPSWPSFPKLIHVRHIFDWRSKFFHLPDAFPLPNKQHQRKNEGKEHKEETAGDT